MLDDYFGDAELQAQDQQSAGEGRAGGRGRGRGRGKADGKSSAKKLGSLQKCIVPDCTELAGNHTMFCRPHDASWKSLETQTKAKQGVDALAELQKLKDKGREVDRGTILGDF